MVSNIFVLDKNLRTKKALSVNGRNTFFSDIYNMNLSTGTESYEFSTNVEGIDESDYIMFHYHDQYKLFQITEIEQDHEEGKIITTVYGECASLELINGAVRPLAETVEMNAIEFIDYVLDGSEWQIHKYSKSLLDKKIPVKIDKTTQRWQLIQDYMGSFGYEITSNVKYENGFVKAKYIDVYAEGCLGNITYKRFEYGRNVKGITKKKDIYDFCTALILDTKQDVKDTEYNIGGYTKAKGDDVIYATNENKQYNAGRQYIFGVYEDNNSETPGEVVENALAELKKRAVPHFDYECDTALTYAEYEDINIGDTVYVIDHSFTPMVTLQARVGELEISFTDRNNCKCNLTNYKEIRSKIDVKLTAGINDIIKTYFPLDGAKIALDSLGPGHLNIQTYDYIKSDIVDAQIGIFEELYTEKLIAEEGYIGRVYTAFLEADEAIIGDLTATNATIQNLKADMIKADEIHTEKIDANIANIGTLNANLANIDSIINGNLTSDNILSFHITADKVTMADGFIQNGHIASLDAGKINAGILNTNNVVIGSDTGGITLAKETMQFKDENGKVRIQIGRDASNNFTFVLYDSLGKGQLINQDGIVSSDAISDGLIRDGHIDTNANISGAKIDMSSLFTEMNGSTETLKSTKIYLDDKKQTLDVAFDSLSTTVDGNTQSIKSNTSSIKQTQESIETLVSESESRTDGKITELSNKYTSLEQDLDGFKTTVSETYTTRDETNDVINLVDESVSSLIQSANNISASVKEVSASLDSMSGEMTTLSKQVAATMTSDQVKLEIQSQLSGVNVDEVTTSTGYTFDGNGLTIDKNGSEMSTTITEDGMTVYKNGAAVLTANNNGVDAKNLHATTYLIVGNNSRFEDYGSNRTGCFYIK